MYPDLANRDLTTFRDDDMSHQADDTDTLEDVSTCSTITELEFIYLDSNEEQIDLQPCHSPRWAVGLPQGSRWRFEVRVSGDLDPNLHRWSQLMLSEPTSTELEPTISTTELNFSMSHIFDEESSSYPQSLTGELEFEVSATGEHHLSLMMPAYGARMNGARRIPLHQEDMKTPAQLWSRLTCLSGCDQRATRYPIVLIHGYAGVDEYFGVLDYFYRVPDYIRAQGYDVYVPSLSPIARSEDRAQQLSRYLDDVQASTGARRFNLIGHSQGGLDARVLISDLGLGEHDRVASLTTIATPHQGIPINFTDFFSIQDFSAEYLQQFNERYPDHPAVRYFSWSARTCTLLELSCLREQSNEVVTPFLLASYTLLRLFGPNDGLIPTANMIYGEHLGELNADHFDQIGQIADRDRGPFVHRPFYLNEAHRLKNLGF